jgi:hypothetical protein
MSLYGVRVNGVPKLTGGIFQSAGGVSVPSSAGAVQVFNVGTSTNAAYELGTMRWNTNVLELGEEIGGGGSSRDIRIKSGGNILFAGGNGSDAWFFSRAGVLTPNSSNAADIGSTGNTIRDIHIGRYCHYAQVLSTFAQAATITNGPRAANPVTWVEVQYGTAGAESTGRIPIW